MINGEMSFLLDKLIQCWHLEGLEKNLFPIRSIMDKVKVAKLTNRPIDYDEISERLEGKKEYVPLSQEEIEEGEKIIHSIIEKTKDDDWAWCEIPERIVARMKERREQEQTRIKLEQQKEKDRERIAFLEKLQRVFEEDFLFADEFFQTESGKDYFDESDYEEKKADFVKRWAGENLQPLLKGKELDNQQATAIGTVTGDILVRARAGSGKTSTLTSRAAFLQMHCKVPPDSMLLLAFNRNAAEEIEERLKRLLGENIPYVMTFHALAYALVNPKEELIYDDEVYGNKLENFISEIITNNYDEGERFQPKIRELMLKYFKTLLYEKLEKQQHLPASELIALRRALRQETLAGEMVTSNGEKLIANTLFSNDIEYSCSVGPRGNNMFNVEKSGFQAAIFYFDDNGRGSYRKNEIKSIKDKLSWKKLTPIFVSRSDLTSNGAGYFSNMVLEKLKQAGIEGRPLTEDEIWEKIKDRALRRFCETVKSFVQRCRKLNLGVDKLISIIDEYQPFSEYEPVFLDVGRVVYSIYLKELKRQNKQDFDGLMWDAISRLRRGTALFSRKKESEIGDLKKLRYILVDEFQDFSEPFYAMLKQIRNLNKNVNFFCVGDDWQAINGFAGSDLKYFENFGIYFENHRLLDISTNYRSAPEIVCIGNALMNDKKPHARPSKTDPGRVEIAYLDNLKTTRMEDIQFRQNEFIAGLMRLVSYFLKKGNQVTLLSRTNSVSGFSAISKNQLDVPLKYINTFFKEDERENISISTVHRFKGLESDAVIIIDSDPERYPLIHPSWIFLRIFDPKDKLCNEERRLFYVALTRAKSNLILLRERGLEGREYLNDVSKIRNIREFNWANTNPVISKDKVGWIELRVSDALHVKRMLKDRGFFYNSKRQSWEMVMSGEEFDFDKICSSSWAVKGVCIEALSSAGERINYKKIQ